MSEAKHVEGGSAAALAETPALGPLVPILSSEERVERKAAAVALLRSWRTEGDQEQQRREMEALRKALGLDRVASNRSLFP